MRILPINNINTQNTQFKAKFPKRDVKEFLREIENNNDVDIVPKLYTMLDIVKKYSGKRAQIQHVGTWHKILIDGESVSGNKIYFCAIHALRDATVNQKGSFVKEAQFKRLSEEEFENEYYKNCKKTVNDIERIFEG